MHMMYILHIFVLLVVGIKSCFGGRHSCEGIEPQANFNTELAGGKWYLQYVAGRAGGLDCVEFEYNQSFRDAFGLAARQKRPRGNPEEKTNSAEDEINETDTERARKFLTLLGDTRKKERTSKLVGKYLEKMTGLSLDMTEYETDDLKKYLRAIMGENVKLPKRDPIIKALNSVETYEFYNYSDYENYLVTVLCYGDENHVWISSRTPNAMDDMALLDAELAMVSYNIPMSRDLVPIGCK